MIPMPRTTTPLLLIALTTSFQLLAPITHASVLDDASGGAKPARPSDLSPTLQQSNTPTTSPFPNSSQPKQLKPVLSSGANNGGPFDKLALALAQSSGADGKLTVSIGNFLDGDSDQLSPHSSEVKDELAITLPKTGKFEIITRERLADLQNESKFQSSDIVQTGTETDKVGVKAVNGIIRGRIYSKPTELMVYAQIAYLEGGEIRQVKITIPSSGAVGEKAPIIAESRQIQPNASTTPPPQGVRRFKHLQEPKNTALPPPTAPKSQGSDHPFVKQINQRVQRLEEQVKNALADGTIKPRKASEIRAGIQRIKRQETRFLLENDGFLTKSERDQLNKEEDQLGEQIRMSKKANKRN